MLLDYDRRWYEHGLGRRKLIENNVDDGRLAAPAPWLGHVEPWATATNLFSPMNRSLDLWGAFPRVNELAAEGGAASWLAPWSNRVSIG